MIFSDVIILYFLLIKSGFLFMWPVLTEVTIMLDNCFKANPGDEDLPWPGIEPQSPSPQPVVIALSYNVAIRVSRTGFNSHLKGIKLSALSAYLLS